jgi:hypothetical protein
MPMLIIFFLLCSSVYAKTEISCQSLSSMSYKYVGDSAELVEKNWQGNIRIEVRKNSLKLNGRQKTYSRYDNNVIILNNRPISQPSRGEVTDDKYQNLKLNLKKQGNGDAYMSVNKRSPRDCQISRGLKCFTSPERFITFIDIDRGSQTIVLSNYKISNDKYLEYLHNDESLEMLSYEWNRGTYTDCIFSN